MKKAFLAGGIGGFFVQRPAVVAAEKDPAPIGRPNGIGIPRILRSQASTPASFIKNPDIVSARLFVLEPCGYSLVVGRQDRPLIFAGLADCPENSAASIKPGEPVSDGAGAIGEDAG